MFPWNLSVIVISLFLLSACQTDEFDIPPWPGTVADNSNLAPVVQKIEFSDNTQGEINLSVFYHDAEGDEVELAISFSRDGGKSWQPANLRGQESNIVSAGKTGQSMHIWEIRKNLGFRQPLQALVRVIPADIHLTGEAFLIEAPVITSPQVAASAVNHPILYYGQIDETAIAHLETYELAVVHPSNANLTRETVAAIQDGIDPDNPGDDVLVLCYISVGEDLRTAALSDEQMRNDPRFHGDGTGPRVDPRGVDAAGQSLDDLDPLGAPSPGGTGFASWYLDDNSVSNDPQRIGDGLPDRNAVFGAAFVNAGDPAWFNELQKMTFEDSGVPGLKEILTMEYGRGLGCDGLFLDTIDTAAPNSFTDASSHNQSEFEWTAPGFSTFIQRLRDAYPQTLLLQNRGLFFFNPDFPHYAHNAGRDIDFLLFESYRLDSNTGSEFNPNFYADNKYNYLPKIMAEANRSDGFKVISLGYAEGPVDRMAYETLLGENILGLESLLTDILETQDRAGFRHYITDGGVTLLNDFVRQRGDLSDHQPPVWTSTYNANRQPFPENHQPPNARIGVQQVTPLERGVLLHWDVALDKHGVKYVAYYQDQPFDFSQENPLSRAARIILETEEGNGYFRGTGPNVYPYQARVEGLQPGTQYHFIIRAVDDSSAANEDGNEVVISATTGD